MINLNKNRTKKKIKKGNPYATKLYNNQKKKKKYHKTPKKKPNITKKQKLYKDKTIQN